ncbi:MAG: AAA family ATPase, partial [Colwellia sp.]
NTGVNFTEGQKESLIQLLKSEDRFNGVQGHAGVGKTFMLKPLVGIAQEQGINVKVAAPFGEIANKLGSDLGVESNTLKSLLFELEKEVKQKKSRIFSPSKTESKQAMANLFSLNNNNKNQTLIIVDEASTINSPDMASLVTYTSLLDYRVVLSGDRAQLGGVERGMPNAQMIDNGMSTSINTDIVRQKEGTQARYVVDSTYARKFGRALDKLDDKVYEDPNRDKRIGKFVTDYIALKEKDPDHLGLIMDNKSRLEATELIRDVYKKTGKISSDEIKFNTLINAKNDGVKKRMAQYYTSGMRVRFLQKYKKINVEKDQYFTVVSSTSREVTLSDGRRTFKWEPSKYGGNKELGGVTSYYNSKIGLSKGDEIRFKDKNKELDVKNGRQGTVVEIKDGNVIIKGQDGKIRTLNPSNSRHQHLEHSYISTAYTAQGLTGRSVQAMADSYQKNLLNDSSFLVAVSRAKSDIRLYVDSKEKVVSALEKRSGLKKSGLDHSEKDNNKEDKEQKFEQELKQKEQKRITDTFVSQPKSQTPSIDNDANKGMPKQNQREKTFLP